MKIAQSDLYGFWPTQPPADNPDERHDETLTPSEKDTVKLGNRSASLRTDAISVTQFMGSGILYKDAAEQANEQLVDTPPLSDAPIVKLEDPLLIAPGWTTQPEKFDNLINHLLKSPDNGARAVYLKQGGVFTDKECTNPTTVQDSDKIFVAVYDSVLSPPSKTAPQLAESLELVKAVHGEKVDLLGYSMGGVAVRTMLDRTDKTVDQVAFLGVSHHGTRFAALGNYVIKRDIKFAMKLASLHPGHLPAMQWMLPEDPADPDSNPNLSQLNSNIEKQKSQTTEMLNIGADGFATITKPWGGSEGGDGLVEKSSVELDGVPTVMLKGRGTKQHGFLPSDTDAFVELAKFFDWQAS